MIAFTLAGIQSLSSAYVKNIFSFKENLSGEDSDRLDEFLSAVEFAINNLSALRNTRIDFLSLDELREYLFLSANFSEKNGIRDIHFEEQITAGNTKARVYAITDDEFLPRTVSGVWKGLHCFQGQVRTLYVSFRGIWRHSSQS
ncbi:hypothetical protein NIB75_12325 [Bacteroides uniformis]|nr:hypothetical protein [Bacteroides uniformis]